MKKILSYIIMGILGVTAFTACSDDESYPTPTALDASTLSYEAKAGAVKLKWKIPDVFLSGILFPPRALCCLFPRKAAPSPF